MKLIDTVAPGTYGFDWYGGPGRFGFSASAWGGVHIRWTDDFGVAHNVPNEVFTTAQTRFHDMYLAPGRYTVIVSAGTTDFCLAAVPMPGWVPGMPGGD